MRESDGRGRPTRTALAVVLAVLSTAATADRPAAPDGEREALQRDPQCGSKAAMDALGEFFRVQGEILVASGRSAGRVADAAARLAPAAAEAANARTELGAIAGDVAKAGPDAARLAATLAKALGDLERDAGAAAALDRAALLADGGALEASAGPFAATCAGCAFAMSATVADFVAGGAGPGLAASGPCGSAVEEAGRISDLFAKIRKFVGALVTLSGAIRSSAQDAGAAGDALTRLAPELGRNPQPGLARLEASLNRAIDAVGAAGQTYDAEVAPHAAKIGPSLLQQLADNADRLMACHAKLQDLAGRKTKILAPIRFNGALVIPGGITLARPVAKVRLGILPAAKGVAP